MRRVTIVTMNSLSVKVAGKLLQLPMVMAALLFLPAWTLNYWEGWIFIGVFFICTLAITVYLAVNDPKLLERRMKAGPVAEKQKSQKRIMTLTMISFIGLVLLPAIDHRFSWSKVPVSAVICGNIFIVLGFLVTLLVLRSNTFAASTIEIAKGHKVISSGPYALVRHPMYSGAVIMMLGIPLALGSWWGLIMVIPASAGIVLRLLDEETFLKKNLKGYTEYTRRVRHRLIPFVW